MKNILGMNGEPRLFTYKGYLAVIEAVWGGGIYDQDKQADCGEQPSAEVEVQRILADKAIAETQITPPNQDLS